MAAEPEQFGRWRMPNSETWLRELALDIEAGIYDPHAGELDDQLHRDPRDEGEWNG